MKAQILSLNCGHPAPLEWQGKQVLSSMQRLSVPGPVLVHKDHIEGNSFGNPKAHGLEHSVLYAFGMKSALEFVRLLGLDRYEPGMVGENVTLDDLDETKVSVGDIFRFGTVEAQATFPRIPCGKVSLKMRHENGQKALQQCERSGVYFRIMKPGEIDMGSKVERISNARHTFLISEVYKRVLSGLDFTMDERKLALLNGAFPKKITTSWESVPTGNA